LESLQAWQVQLVQVLAQALVQQQEEPSVQVLAPVVLPDRSCRSVKLEVWPQPELNNSNSSRVLEQKQSFLQHPQSSVSVSLPLARARVQVQVQVQVQEQEQMRVQVQEQEPEQEQEQEQVQAQERVAA